MHTIFASNYQIGKSRIITGVKGQVEKLGNNCT